MKFSNKIFLLSSLLFSIFSISSCDKDDEIAPVTLGSGNFAQFFKKLQSSNNHNPIPKQKINHDKKV